MAIEFRCIQCQKLLRVGDDAIGKKARCPDCGTIQETRGSVGGSLTGFSPTGDASVQPSPVNPATNPFSEAAPNQTPFGASVPNPYVAPHTPGSSPTMTREMALAKIKTPAIGILVCAGLACLIQLIWAASMVFVLVNGKGRIEEFVFNLGGMAVSFAICVTSVMGALKMQRLESYGLSMTAAVLSLLPCTSSCCVIGIPFGIWALIVLVDPQVKQYFR